MHWIFLFIFSIVCFPCDYGKKLVQKRSLIADISTDSTKYGLTDKDLTFFRRKRSLTIEYPTEPLEDKVPTTYSVIKSKKKQCGLFLNSEEDITTYKVMMIEKEFGEIYSNYYVIPGAMDFERIKDPEIEEFHIQQRYANQIGYAVCSPGWIQKIWVNSGRIDDEEDTDVRINARQCGIASVLAELCLIDPKLNEATDLNKVFEMLKEADYEDIDARNTQLKSNCNHLMGLEMSAKPKIAAFGYFNAAIRAKYLSLVVQERYHETKDELSFNIYSTTIAKENYNAETGMIGECDENEECNGMDAYWYFCKK